MVRQCAGMFSDRHARPGIVGNYALLGSHGIEWRIEIFVVCYLSEQWSCLSSGTFDLPQRIPTMYVLTERVQRSRLRKDSEISLGK